MPSVLDRLSRLEALTAAAPAGGPATRIKSDYGPSGKVAKGGGRKVASKAGEKRYGLPIGTPLGQTKSKNKGDSATQVSYDTFMAANTPADQRKAASWMASDDLKRAGEALFSFESTNERDESARLALVKELADRGIDPRSVGYRGSPVVLNPNPKQDPVERAAQTAQRKTETAQRKVENEQKAAQRKADTEAKRVVREGEAATRKQATEAARVVREAEQATKAADRARKDAEDAVKKAQKDQTTQAVQAARQALAQAISEGAITEAEARRRMAQLT